MRVAIEGLLQRRRTAAVAVAAAIACASLAVAARGFAQGELTSGGLVEARTLVQVTATPVTVPAGGSAATEVTLVVMPGWHINANPPSLDYMIPTVVKLRAESGIRGGAPAYPRPKEQKLSFEETPLRVFDGEAVVRLPVVVAAGTAPGAVAAQGTVQFQACNDEVCLAPASVPFEVQVTVIAGDTSATTEPAPPANTPPLDPAGGTATSGSGFTTAPPPGTAAASGSPGDMGLAFFLGLFLSGLALNLTPCVYPMLGVTVSIFGARKESSSPLQVAGLAVLYVLGIATMYTGLGVAAAFTGGLFGGLLQNPLVLAGIGVLFIVLSLSMFGVYSLQPPPWLLERLGGSGRTNAVGIFLSGLVVGVFAAPCIGPPVVALLALVGARGDPMFGFTTFFTLAMGLGAPYLVLGTFSGLLARLPRSGDWLIWVERLFGVILLSVGAFYLMLGFAPKLAAWVPPVALLAGGIYLGFIEKSAAARAGFRRLKMAVGTLAVLAGIVLVATTPSQGVVFEPFDEAAMAGTLRQGNPVVLDFTANWCVPCHELERVTFADRRVREAMKPFRAYRVDLTHYDSPEAERWRKQYGITGVPTVVFLAPDGSEIRAARVEGFVGPSAFLERIRVAAGTETALR
jgi:thiol:disulfide interchange protein DsbD